MHKLSQNCVSDLQSHSLSYQSNFLRAKYSPIWAPWEWSQDCTHIVFWKHFSVSPACQIDPVSS